MRAVTRIDYVISLVFHFPAGRYHATPWGRHVNEADIEWPPSPWRILRALIAVYWRKADRHRFNENDLATLIDALASVLPVYRLPEAIHVHTQHYMPIREGSSEKTTLVFDAFARVDATDELAIGWPNVDLSARSAELLAHLTSLLGYLGRAEAWVEADVREREEKSFPWVPHDPDHAPLKDQRLVQLLAPFSPDKWQVERARHLESLPPAKERNRGQKEIAVTLHEQLAAAIALDTADWQAVGWSFPPSARRVLYHAPILAPIARKPRSRLDQTATPPTVARFVLAGKPRPRIEEAVRIGELMRLATLAQFGRDKSGKWRAPSAISGRDAAGKPLAEVGHGHAFFLPEDADGDGFIDHVVVFVRNGLGDDVRRALDRVTRLWLEPRGHSNDEDDTTGDREEWRLALEGFGMPADFKESRLLGGGSHWRSATPYLMPWHAKRKFGVAEQIRRELVERELLASALATTIVVQEVPEISINGGPRRPIHFHRFRSRRGLTQPDRFGRFVSLTFPEEMTGPIALGFACHFGLGMFCLEN
jgi:CRISPR-associated protein Csb2